LSTAARAAACHETAARIGEAEAARRISLAGGDDLLERLACFARIAPAQRVDAGLGDRAGSIGGVGMFERISLCQRPARRRSRSREG
jgi:hypothetical protein